MRSILTAAFSTCCFILAVGASPTNQESRTFDADWRMRDWSRNGGDAAYIDLARVENFERRELEAGHQLVTAVQNAVPEATNYDTNVAEPYGWLGAAIGFVGGSLIGAPVLGAAIGSAVLKRDKSADDFDISSVKVFGSSVELTLYDTTDEKATLLASPVIRAELYERPLAADVPQALSAALDGKQSGVVATLSDGRKFLVVKGNKEGRGSGTVLILENHMTRDWTRVRSKDIHGSTLGDLVKAGGRGYNPFADNGNAAAERIMALE